VVASARIIAGGLVVAAICALCFGAGTAHPVLVVTAGVIFSASAFVHLHLSGLKWSSCASKFCSVGPGVEHSAVDNSGTVPITYSRIWNGIRGVLGKVLNALCWRVAFLNHVGVFAGWEQYPLNLLMLHWSKTSHFCFLLPVVVRSWEP
jgi:hypothetical protein